MDKSVSGLRYQAGAALGFLAVLALVHANIEAGMNDDWSFIRTVRDLAATGHLIYNGWSAPLIGFQAYWGALFVKLFGFSFFTVRASGSVLTLLSIPVLWALLRSVKLSETQAFFGLLMFLLSPLNLPSLATFMTDIPAFLLFAAALLCALKAWDSENDGTAMLWIVATTLFGLLSGSVRQIYWLTGICFLLVLAVVRLKSKGGRLLIAGCIVLTALFGVACSHWLAAQPYVPAETTLQAWSGFPLRTIAPKMAAGLMRACISIGLMCLPFSVLLMPIEIRKASYWKHLLIVPGAAVIVYALAHPLPWLGNTLTQYGVLLPYLVSVGERPEVLPWILALVLATIGFASFIYALISCARSAKGADARRQTERNSRAASGGEPDTATVLRVFLKGWREWIQPETGLGRFAILTIPFVLAYLFVLAVRLAGYGLYDRYLIPLVFVTSTLMLGLYARQSRGVGGIAWGVAAVFALYAIATTHDYYSEARAKLAATQKLLHAGIGRESILSGLEFDLWTQADRTGYVNTDWIKFPPNAYHEMEDCNGDDDVQTWWRPMTPDLRQRYVISISPLSSLRATDLVDYWRWLPPKPSHVYVEQVDPHDPPLSCKAGSGE